MSSSLSSRRTRIAGLAITLAAGGLLLAPSSAQAGVIDSPQLQNSVSFFTGGGCTPSGAGPANQTTPFAADGVPVSGSVSSSAQVHGQW